MIPVAWLSVLKNPKVVGAIVAVLLALWIYGQFQGALTNKYEAGYEAAVAEYEAAKNKTLTSDITESNQDSAENLENRNKTETKNEAVDDVVIGIITKKKIENDTCNPVDIAGSLELLDSIP